MTFVVTIVVNSRQQNCFGFVSPTKNAIFSTTNFGIFHCVLMQRGETRSFIVQIFGDRPPFNFLHLNPIFALVNGVSENDQAILEPVIHMPNCQNLELEPVSFEDWNIIQTSACVVEELFLDQIRVVQNGTNFVLFVAPNIPAKLKVVKTVPNTGRDSAVIVTNSTEVSIIPKADPLNKSFATISRPSTSVSIFADKISGFDNISANNFIKEFISNFEIYLKFRIFPIENFFQDFFQEFNKINFVVVSNVSKSNYFKKTIVQIKSHFSGKIVFGFLFEISQNYFSKKLENLSRFLNDYPEHCLISSSLQKTEDFQDFTWISIKNLTKNDIIESKELIANYKFPNSEFKGFNQEKFKSAIFTEFFSKNFYLPILLAPTGLILHFDDQIEIKLIPENSESDVCYFFWIDDFPKIKQEMFEKITENDESKKQKPKILSKHLQKNLKSPFSFQEFFVKTLRNQIRALELAKMTCRILIHGPHGSGKTLTLQFLANQLFHSRIRFFINFHDCLEWKGKSCETIEKQLSEFLLDSEARKPAIFFLDNVDFLNSSIDDEDRRKFVDKIYKRIAQQIKMSKVHFVFSTTRKLPESLNSISGSRFFNLVFNIPELGQNERRQILAQILNENVELDSEIEKQVQNFSLGEMVKFCERILLIKNENFKDAINEALKMTPTAGRQIGQPSDEKLISFGSLGGLKKVKQNLKEIYLWQNKYSKLYVKCGLKIGGRAILYGPSGCGKSLCMRAIATESKLPVISIKGPELLSKYIGASEQNVRSIFERARATKPCLIIFDEFDALVPKRGHDSTGVTDRVVNQFLTELDGVDSSNDGIYVIASTNRIDLIDEALLRPGRFDHKIFVGFPLENERKEILEILGRDLTIDKNVDFGKLAQMTENWTCAELRGLFLNANFKAMDEQGLEPILKMSHFLTAFSESHQKQPESKITIYEPASRITLA